MKRPLQFLNCLFVLACLSWNALPCGPSSIEPLFKYQHAPENPYENFAAGRIGIVLPTMRRAVLFAAYRYLNGGGFTPEEQKALVEVWNADFNNKDFRDDDVTEAVKEWVNRRKEIVGKEEKPPEIYTERAYGGYDFFPNCTKNAFETASETLSDRIASHGSDSKDVRNWLEGQDAVFYNCASGKQAPADLQPGSPEWLQKDRAYQMAAARFYSMDYDEAKKRFEEIAQDFESPWQETAAYLVARTLIRQASLVEDAKSAEPYYIEAEDRLSRFVSTSGKFTESADGLQGLIKYRLRPKQRVRELANKLAYQGGSSRLRQDLIDYTWLLDKFEADAYDAEEKRKAQINANSNVANSANTHSNMMAAANSISSTNVAANSSGSDPDEIEVRLYSDDYKQNWQITVPVDATDEEVASAAERVVGAPLSAEMAKRLREARRESYTSRFSENRQSGYVGRYIEEDPSLSILPEFLRHDEMTDWLFVYQIQSAEAYLYALNRYRQTGSDLWLMTAISKAEKSSAELPRMIDAAARTAPSSAAFPTIAYHLARIYISQSKNAEAKKLLDEVYRHESEYPISTANRFAELRMGLGVTLDDFLKYALRRPFAFSYGPEQSGSVEDFIEQSKSYYDPEYHKEGREAYEREIEEQFREELKWQDRLMFDYETTNMINKHFSTSVLLEAQRSAALPDYMRSRFASVLWVRSVLLGDLATAAKVAPAFAAAHPQLEQQLKLVTDAKTDLQREAAVLHLLLKNPMLTPYLESGIGATENEIEDYYSNDWWCAPYDEDYEGDTDKLLAAALPKRPLFLTAAQIATAQSERSRLKEIGDAPAYLADKVLKLQERAPSDPRVPEMLHIAFIGNGWRKYSCGGDQEMRNRIAELMRARYPNNEWTRRVMAIVDEENRSEN